MRYDEEETIYLAPSRDATILQRRLTSYHHKFNTCNMLNNSTYNSVEVRCFFSTAVAEVVCFCARTLSIKLL